MFESSIETFMRLRILLLKIQQEIPPTRLSFGAIHGSVTTERKGNSFPLFSCSNFHHHLLNGYPFG